MSPEFGTAKGVPYPLGATVQPGGINFSVFASGPDQLNLLFFPDGMNADPMRIKMNHSGSVWHTFISTAEIPLIYAFEDDKHRGRYLLDPYGKAVTGGEYHTGDDNADKKRQLCSYLYKSQYNWENDQLPRIPLSQTIIYEMHIRGFSRHASSHISKPGTYAGIVEKISYLKDLGITAVELLPVAEFNEFAL
jgi:isoamylase